MSKMEARYTKFKLQFQLQFNFSSISVLST